MIQGLKSQNQPTAEGQQEASMPAYELFQNYCSGCGKSIPSFAKDRSGNVEIVYCNSVCKTAFVNEERMKNFKTIVPFRKSISTDELTKKLSQKHWANREYLVEEIPV